MLIEIPVGLTQKETHEFLIKNKALHLAQKKNELKRGDAFRMSGRLIVNEQGEITKAIGKQNTLPEDLTSLDVTSIINTTNWMDSHLDVHIPGIWNKSLKENKSLYLLQEHDLSFKGIISDEVKAEARKMLWRELDVELPGQTEALVFISKVERARNEYMFDQYKLGRVRNHSVGMRYVSIEFAINNKDYKDEYAIWNKYIGEIANYQDAEEQGYFWVVTQAKVIEGSAVAIGSNIHTPTFSMEASKNTITTSDTSTSEGQPSKDTGDREPQTKEVDWDKIAQKFLI